MRIPKEMKAFKYGLAVALLVTGIATARAQDTGGTLYNNPSATHNSAPLFLDRGAGSAGAGTSAASSHPFFFGRRAQSQETGPSTIELRHQIDAENNENMLNSLAIADQHASALQAQSEAMWDQQQAELQAHNEAVLAAASQTGPAATDNIVQPSGAIVQAIGSPPMIYNKAKQDRRSHGPLFLQ